ncbi:MAG: sugar-binding domain-containing protein [Anaerolineaceae bacterium]
MTENSNTLDRVNLLANVAEMYYIEGKDQSVIADEVGVSRSMVSRMLTDARNRGIVEIRIHRPIQSEKIIGEQLKSLFDLQSVLVTSIRTQTDHQRMLADLGRAGASLLLPMLTPGKTVGLAWGTSISATVDALEISYAIPIKVVQLIGAFGARTQEYDGHALVQRFAEKVGGEAYFINAPYLCQTPDIARAFMDSPGIQETIELGKQVDIALLGIGTTEVQYSSYYLSGYVQVEELQRLHDAGAVGDIAGNHFNINGEFFKDDFFKRQITIQSEDLLRIPKRLCVAGGPGKVNAIIGALRTGVVNMLVTDSITASNILSTVNQTNP